MKFSTTTTLILAVCVFVMFEKIDFAADTVNSKDPGAAARGKPLCKVDVDHSVPLGSETRMVTIPRWIENDNGYGWVCRAIAVGDNGASVMAGKGMFNVGLTLYPAGTSTPVFGYPISGNEYPKVDIADRADLAAGMVFDDIDPGAGEEFEASVYIFRTTGNGTPEWSYSFPVTGDNAEGGVAVSDDGDVVLTWKPNPYTSHLMIEAFEGSGTPISSAQLQTTMGHFEPRAVFLTDDGSRAYIFIPVETYIYDVTIGTVEQTFFIPGSFDSHAISGDGGTMAYGGFGFFRVYRETAPGTWSEIVYHVTSTGCYTSRLALSRDGSRLGYQVQQYSPAYDHIEIGMYDVDANTNLFTHSFDAPGTIYQLICSGVAVDDNGEYVAGISWGDSLKATPEVFVFDASGNPTCQIDTRGSALVIDLDADGDVLAIGTMAGHCNAPINGGDIVVADVFEQEIHVLGFPQLGGTIDLSVVEGGDTATIGVFDHLGDSHTSWGEAEVDFATLLRTIGPTPIPSGGLSMPLSIPGSPSLAGRDVHFQGLIMDTPSGHLTNKVSVRLIP